MGLLGAEMVKVRDVGLELVDRGSGRTIVFLHSGDGLAHCGPLLDELSGDARVIAPSHPGFGRSDLPLSFRSVDDLAYFYLDLFEQMQLRDVVLVGASFGGWIAAEIAIRNSSRVSHLILSDPLGIRVSTEETAVDIQDFFTLHPADLERRCYVDASRWRVDANVLSDEELLVVARNRESLCLFGWSPYMYNPLLKRWLHRIKVPTLVVWGEQDGIVSRDYGRAWADAIPGARFEVIGSAAHHPPMEQPVRFAAAVREFASVGTAVA